MTVVPANVLPQTVAGVELTWLPDGAEVVRATPWPVGDGEPRRRTEINLHLTWTRTDGWWVLRDSYCRASSMLFNCPLG